MDVCGETEGGEGMKNGKMWNKRQKSWNYFRNQREFHGKFFLKGVDLFMVVV